MPEIVVSKESGPDGGRYVARVAGIADVAELIFSQRNPRPISADHTEAPETLRGTGAAKALVDFMVADARANGFKIFPACPYVRAQYAKNPTWRDAFAIPPDSKKE